MKRREWIEQVGLTAVSMTLIPSVMPFQQIKTNDMKEEYEVAIIGGSYAGLSAALALGRSMRNVVVIDSGMPCNRSTPHSHNFLTQDGRTPGDISAHAKQEVASYPTVSFLKDRVVEASGSGVSFEIRTADGETMKAQRLVLSTGIRDILPEVPCFADCWGKSIIHCPYCHGYEFRSAATAIYADAEKAMHLAPMVHNLTQRLYIITKDVSDYTAEQRESLKDKGVELVEGDLESIRHNNGSLQSVLLDSGREVEIEAMYASLPFEQHSDVGEQLGCEFNEQGYIKIDPMFKTTVPGVYACGDMAGMMRSIANAVYGGNITGALINNELSAEAFNHG